MTLKSQVIRNVLPTTAGRHMRKPFDIDFGDPCPLVIRVVGVIRVIFRRFGEVTDSLPDSFPFCNRWFGYSENRIDIRSDAYDDKTLSRLSQPVIG